MKFPTMRWDFLQGIDGFDARLEALADSLGLAVKRSTTKSLPPNFHWHLSRPDQRGVLEVTWIFGSGEAWMSIRANRRGEWTESVVEEFLKEFGQA